MEVVKEVVSRQPGRPTGPCESTIHFTPGDFINAVHLDMFHFKRSVDIAVGKEGGGGGGGRRGWEVRVEVLTLTETLFV